MLYLPDPLRIDDATVGFTSFNAFGTSSTALSFITVIKLIRDFPVLCGLKPSTQFKLEDFFLL